VRGLNASIVRVATLSPAGCETRARAIAVGRSLIALAQMSVVLFTPDELLFMDPVATRCSGIDVLTLWCVAGDGSRVISIGILLLVASGFGPRWTCIPHWYVTLSIALSIVPVNGGDKIAQIATMLLVPMFLGDGRRWQWVLPSESMTPRWQGVAFAALGTLRVQVAIVYVIAILSKLFDRTWREGDVFNMIMNSPSFGPDARIRDFLRPIIEIHGLAPVLTWSVMIIQGAIPVLIFLGRRARLVACALGIAFHVGVIIVLRMPSFGLVMIGLLLIVCAPPAASLVGKIDGSSLQPR
jgi:antimicrobial peptide system SdpB family protein